MAVIFKLTHPNYEITYLVLPISLSALTTPAKQNTFKVIILLR
jgi:hypothetical protein